MPLLFETDQHVQYLLLTGVYSELFILFLVCKDWTRVFLTLTTAPHKLLGRNVFHASDSMERTQKEQNAVKKNMQHLT